jgi:AraC-like DNA-binding protein
LDGIRVAEHASDTGSWRVASLVPRGALKSSVSVFHAYEERNTAFRRRRELPDGCAVLIFNLGEELRVEHAGMARAFGEGGAFYSGASERYAVTETDGAQSGAQVKFTLLGARRFLGRPLIETGDALVDARQAWSVAANELGDRLAEAKTQTERLRLLAEAVELKLREAPAIQPDLAFAFERLSGGDIGVREIARAIGMTREGFSRAFRREFGLSPKTFARVRRFARTLSLRDAGQTPLDGASLAAHGGYADQAHMIHVFREFAGASPTALMRRELPENGGFID